MLLKFTNVLHLMTQSVTPLVFLLIISYVYHVDPRVRLHVNSLDFI